MLLCTGMHSVRVLSERYTVGLLINVPTDIEQAKIFVSRMLGNGKVSDIEISYDDSEVNHSSTIEMF